MKKVVVLGAGESGVGAAILAKVKGFEVFVTDFGNIPDKYKIELMELSIPFEEGKHSMDIVLAADEIVKSPGIPDKAPVIKAIKEQGISMVSEIEFAARYTSAKFVAITGSNGKTTTTLLTYHLIKNAGLNVGLAGNIGQSLARQVAENDFDYYVLELSSFQLDYMFDFKADVAVLLNITPDHLDRYEYKFENYIDSKYRICQNQKANDYFISVSDDPIIQQERNNRVSEAFQFQVSIENRVLNGAFLSNDHIMVNVHNHITKVFKIPVSDLPLNGKHNMMNISSAVLAALAVGVTEHSILKSLPTFQNAAHRLEFAGMINQIKYINDSKATNVDSVKYALDAFPKPIIWIAGGVDKGNDYSVLDELVYERVKVLICLGKDIDKLKTHFKGKVDLILEATTMTDAIRLSSEFGHPGDTVLLSPACASFDLFKNYEHRGDVFKDEVNRLQEHQFRLNLLMF